MQPEKPGRYPDKTCWPNGLSWTPKLQFYITWPVNICSIHHFKRVQPPHHNFKRLKGKCKLFYGVKEHIFSVAGILAHTLPPPPVSSFPRSSLPMVEAVWRLWMLFWRTWSGLKEISPRILSSQAQSSHIHTNWSKFQWTLGKPDFLSLNYLWISSYSQQHCDAYE